jgi:hypothetical protein
MDILKVEAIVERLDHHPLAIRVVASRVRLLGAEGLLRTLAEEGGAWLRAQGALARVLRTAWDQLSDTQRELLKQAQVFRGGFDLAAAEAVLDIGADVTATLVALDNRSWLRTQYSDSPPRVQVFRVLRAFVALEAGPPSKDAVRRHANHYNRIAARRLDEGGSGARRLSVELDNLRAAADRTSDPEGRGRATLNLVQVLWRSDCVEEILARTERAEPGVHDRTRARLCYHRARARIRLGQLAVGCEEATHALALARELAERPLAQACVEAMSVALLAMGRRVDVLTLHEANGMSLSRSTYAGERGAAGCFREAARSCELAMVEATERNDPDARAEHAAQLALDIAIDDGDRALGLLESARAWWERTGHGGGCGIYWRNLGLVRLLQADWRGAEAALVQALEQPLDPRSRLVVDVALGEAYLALSDLDSAMDRLNRGVWAARRQEDHLLPRALCVRAGVHALQGRHRCFAADLITATRVLRSRDDEEGGRLVDRMGAYPVLATVREGCETRDFSRASEALKRFDAVRHPEPNERNPMMLKQAWTLSALRDQVIAEHPEVLTGSDVVVAHDLRGLHLPSGEWVDLANQGPPRRLLGALLKANADGSGPAARDWLVTEVWSGERMTGESGANRIRVAVSALRRLGLRDIVQTVPGGYRLNPAHAYRRMPDAGTDGAQIHSDPGSVKRG